MKDSIEENVCSLPEIGAGIEAARVQAGMRDTDLAKLAGVHVSGLGYWKRGEREPGAQLLARVALALNKTPNDFLLRIPPPEGETARFTDVQKLYISRVLRAMSYLNQVNPGPVDIFEMWAAAVEEMERVCRNSNVVPIGTTIKVKEGATLYEPPALPPAPISRRRANSDTVKVVGESPPKYGNKRKGRRAFDK